MENAGSAGNIIAYAAIVLFLLLLLVLFIRTAFMVGSVWFLALSRRRDRRDADGDAPVPEDRPSR